MSRRGAGLLGVMLFASGCAYYNAIYNAERSYDEAEAHRRAGRDSLASQRYQDVVRKAARGYRRDPEGEWGDDALFLLGRARLRLGEIRAARAALEEAAERSEDAELRLAVLVYLALAHVESGDLEAALPLVNRALGGLSVGPALAEAHLLRGQILLSQGQADDGWSDLDRAPELDARIRVEAALMRLRWAIHYDELPRAGEAFTLLLSYSEAGERLDTVVALANRAAEEWSPEVVARLLSGADTARWGRVGRGRIALGRARLLHRAGDTATANAAAWAVARGVGVAAAEARVQIARWRLELAYDLAELDEVEKILLPAEEHQGVAPLLDALGALDDFTGVGLTDPLGWFAAAEIARDDLEARPLARGLFLAYADADPDDPWVPKALLAALTVAFDDTDRAWLLGRLETHARSPYVLAARGAPAPGFEALEEDLALRLREMKNR